MTRTVTLDQTHPSGEDTQNTRSDSWLHRIGIIVMMFITVFLGLASLILMGIMLNFTAVPVWLTMLLILADLGVLFAAIRNGRTLSTLTFTVLAWILVGGFAVFLSQQMASTPPITDENGQPITGSIATLESIDLNGSQQWVSIRGYSPDLPVLLFLAGGPGGSELAMTRRYLGELEKHFIIVNWDQPGTGKSFNAVSAEELTTERYVKDAHALTLYLRERFDEDKIYVFGESWGSILGVWMVQQHPELYHAFVSTGQMVAPVENDDEMYELAIKLLVLDYGDLATAGQMRDAGGPPFSQGELLGRFMPINNVLNDYMDAHASGEGVNHNLMLDSLAAPEYGLLDKVNWILGLANTFTTVYPQVYDVDFRTQATALDVPMYFIKGRWDVNASNALLEEYYGLVDAPHKELIWFERSAHTPSWDEPAHFVDVMVNTVLAQNPSTPND